MGRVTEAEIDLEADSLLPHAVRPINLGAPPDITQSLDVCFVRNQLIAMH